MEDKGEEKFTIRTPGTRLIPPIKLTNSGEMIDILRELIKPLMGQYKFGLSMGTYSIRAEQNVNNLTIKGFKALNGQWIPINKDNVQYTETNGKVPRPSRLLSILLIDGVEISHGEWSEDDFLSFCNMFISHIPYGYSLGGGTWNGNKISPIADMFLRRAEMVDIKLTMRSVDDYGRRLVLRSDYQLYITQMKNLKSKNYRELPLFFQLSKVILPLTKDNTFNMSIITNNYGFITPNDSNWFAMKVIDHDDTHVMFGDGSCSAKFRLSSMTPCLKAIMTKTLRELRTKINELNDLDV
jgi:hypothetical protein